MTPPSEAFLASTSPPATDRRVRARPSPKAACCVVANGASNQANCSGVAGYPPRSSKQSTCRSSRENPSRTRDFADARPLSSAAFLLVVSMCQAARHQVRVSFSQGERHVDCSVERDGYPASEEQFAWLETPFATTQHAAFGLGLALMRRAVGGGGEVEARNVPDGGVVVRIRFPVWSDASDVTE